MTKEKSEQVKAVLIDARMCITGSIKYAEFYLEEHKDNTNLETEVDRTTAKLIQEDINHMNSTLHKLRKL